MNWEKIVFEAGNFKDIFVLDVHGHVGAHRPFQLGKHDGSDVAYTARRAGVDAVVVSSLPAIASDYVWGNEQVAEACRKDPDVIYGYAVPNPYYEDCDLTPWMDQPNFRGIKVHGDMQGSVQLNDHRYDAAYELANKRRLPVLVHAWCPWEIEAAADVASRYPDLTIILGHSGMTFRNDAIKAAQKCENILIDTAISATVDFAVEKLVDSVGVERVVYGSDICFFDCMHTLGKIALAKLSDDDKEKIFGLNAKELFRM